MRTLLLATAIAATIMTPADAAKFWVEQGDCPDRTEGCAVVHMEGDIVAGDAMNFAKVLDAQKVSARQGHRLPQQRRRTSL